MKLAKTFGELKKSGYRPRSTRDEMRQNLLEAIKSGKRRFPGIVGFERTVLPQIENAILSKHDILLLGLRGQAKTRIARLLPQFLDEYIPTVKGSQLNESPYEPISSTYKRLASEAGDDLEIEWIHRDLRYNEKLATPDVSVADLIGDLDPIKAVRDKLDLSDENVIHWGIVPRTNRGIFAINELPDLQPRIQVSLLNILEENDIQIRGFPVRVPLDMMFVFTANPEDYTNRGNIITPLKDRISSQINTHYPASIEDGKKITAQEAWSDRKSKFVIPELIKDIIEQIAVEARDSEYVDQTSGVSARLPISAYENLISNIERRAALNGEPESYPRICDLTAIISSIVGKVELVYEGENEGANIVALNLIGEAVKKTFLRYFPKPRKGHDESPQAHTSGDLYQPVVDFFSSGMRLELSDEQPSSEYEKALRSIYGLDKIARSHVDIKNDAELLLAMELILEGLHRFNMIAKESPDNKFIYADMIQNILGS
jgi:magnesium chelatase subunit I